MSILSYSSDLPLFINGLLGRDFAFDIESTGLNPRKDLLIGVALYFDNGEQYYIAAKHTEPTPDGAYPLKTYIEYDVLAKALRPLFLQPDVVMVGHNLKFDLHFLDAAGIEVRGRLFDTMLAAQIINENRDSISLKELAPLELGLALDHYQDLAEYPGFHKDSILAVPLHNAATYALGDVEATWGLYKKYRTELIDEDVEWAFLNIWMPLSYTLFEMEKKGIALDLDLVKKIREEYQTVAQENENQIWKEGIAMVLEVMRRNSEDDDNESVTQGLPASYIVPVRDVLPHVDATNLEIDAVEHLGITLPILRKISKNGKIIGLSKIPWFNPGSNDHIRALLYDWYGLEIPTTVRIKPTESGKQTVSADALHVIRYTLGEQAPKVLDNILDMRKASKFISTYLDRFLSDADPNNNNTIHTWFNQAVADTGRLTSTIPNLNCRAA